MSAGRRSSVSSINSDVSESRALVTSESHLVLVHDTSDSEDLDNSFEFQDGEDDDPGIPNPNALQLSPSVVFLYLLSPHLKLGMLLLPNIGLSLKFGLPALLGFAILAAFSRQIWFMLSRYVRKDDLSDVVVDVFARGRGQRRKRRTLLRAIVNWGSGLLRVLLAVLYIRVSVAILLPLFVDDFPAVTPIILSIIIGAFLLPLSLSQSPSSKFAIYSTWGSLVAFVLWFFCVIYAHSKGILQVNKAWLRMGPLWQGITTIAFTFASSNTLTLNASLRASVQPSASATQKTPFSRSFKFLSVVSVSLALLFSIPLVVFAAFPNQVRVNKSPAPIHPFLVSLNAITLLLGVPSNLVTVPRFYIPEHIRWKTSIPLSRIVVFIAVLVLANVPSSFNAVLSDILIACALSATYFLPALLHIINHFFRRPLSIVFPSYTNTPASSSPVEEPDSVHDPLLQRKEQALQRKQWKRRFIWDLGVWTLLLPVGGGGFAWAIGTLLGKW